MLDWLITPAYAQAGAAQGNGMEGIFMMVLIFVIFYFLLIRPQQKRVKEHRAMVEAIKPGDKVMTGGGIIGTVRGVDDNNMKVEIAEGIVVKVRRDTVASKED
ncbi:MAG: preprotein translocase subunit YajC [Alphaproteobacteria bacterium CG_4_10_14_0_2_um_filter_63_37]|nr:MAG: preprotein translocase subunit YajC [Proteobacteria bacterium CG1_02_64_396]PJA24497.1 MAG: preprotein translocase subunit YajC [Alphaproteobacteria bacterium CG_4_10_14_0_2_um_filter_63_37]